MTLMHTEVYRLPGRFAAWPANYGMWSWGDEIALVFTAGRLDSGTTGFHAVDATRGFETVQTRSLDGGVTWTHGPFPGRVPTNGLSVDEHLPEPLRTVFATEAVPAPGLDLTTPDLALMCGRTGLHAGATSWFYASEDRCRSWRGPFALPGFDLPGVAARSDWIVLGRDEALLMLTAAKSDGCEGRVFCVGTRDGARTFEWRSWVGEEPDGFSIMPATVRLRSGRLLSAVRCSDPESLSRDARHWIDLYASDDLGRTWHLLDRPVEDTGFGGNPPTLTLLPDGRLCLVYGFRAEPYGIHARISADDGATWSGEVVLRSGAGCQDLGYPRTVLRADGALVTAYYYNDSPAAERYIAATVWAP